MSSNDSDHFHDEEETERCDNVSDRRQEYIKDHLNTVKQQCNEFKSCVDELYSKENVHVVLQGGDIELDLICRFLFPETEGNQTTPASSCTAAGRQAIIDDLDKHLEEEMELNSHDHGQGHEHDQDWIDVNTCLNNTGIHVHEKEEEHLRPICSKLQGKREVICNHKIHHHLEGFVNHQLDHIQCTCQSLDKLSPPFPRKYRIAIFASSLLFIILMLVMIFCLCKRRKRRLKRRRLQNEETLSRVGYHISKASSSDDYNTNPYSVPIDPIYKKAQKMVVPVPPPALPPRYTTYMADDSHTADYLLPADLPEIDLHPPNSECRGLTSPDGASVEDISGKPEGSRYDPLGLKSVQPEYSIPAHCVAEKTNSLEEQKRNYFVLEDESAIPKEYTDYRKV